MTPTTDADEAARRLRDQAEAQWRAAHPADGGIRSSADAERLIQELEIHQIELELQRDELLRVQGELERAQARITDLFDHAPTGYLVVDRQGVIVLENRVARRQLLRRHDDLAGRPLTDFVVPESRPAVHRLVADTFAGQASAFADLDLAGADAEPRTMRVEGVASPGRDECRLSLIDVTERRRALRAVRSLQEALNAAQRMETVGRLAGGIAHDFNNLLTVINGNARMLADEMPADAPSRELLDEILGAARRAGELTSQLLAFSRRQPSLPKEVALNAVITGVERLLRRLLGEHVELRLALAPDLPLVTADALQLEQVLVNLVVNARDAMPEGGVVVITTATAALGDGRPAVELSVEDTGDGMPPEVRHRVFEPFFTTKGVGKGTGLGLAVVHGIVEEAGGEVSVESAPGAGACFRCRLPAVMHGRN